MKNELILFGGRFNMARRARRRWLVVLIYAGFAVAMTGSWYFDHWRMSGLWFIHLPTFFVFFFILGGYFGAGLVRLRPRPATTPGFMTALRSKLIQAYKASLLGRFLKFESSPPNPEPRDFVEDERERHQRDHACYQAWGWIVLIVLFLWGYLDPIELDKMHLSAEQLTDLIHGLSLAALILVLTLPQAIILWTEPDMEEPR